MSGGDVRKHEAKGSSENRYNTEMGYDIVVYLGPFYSVYALINLLFKISGFVVYFRIKRNEDNTPLTNYKLFK